VNAIRRVVPELTSLILVIITATVGLVFAPTLSERMIVGWHLGLDGQVSITRGPRLVGLMAIPTVATTMYVALRVTRLALDIERHLDIRVFEILVHLLLGVLALGQIWLVTINL